MKLGTVISFLGILFLGSFGLLTPGAQAQDAGQAELPSAPSASQTQSHPQKTPPPAEQPAPTPQASVQQAEVPAGSAKPTAVPGKQSPNDSEQNQPSKAGNA